SEPAMSYYFPDFAHSIDPILLEQRLQTVSFAPASNQQVEHGPEASAGGATVSGDADVDAALAEGDRFIAAHQPDAAASTFQGVLDRAPGQPRALYGLAVAMVLQGNKARAVELFGQVVASGDGADASSLAWSHVYLGRMHDLEGNREEALQEYR